MISRHKVAAVLQKVVKVKPAPEIRANEIKKQNKCQRLKSGIDIKVDIASKPNAKKIVDKVSKKKKNILLRTYTVHILKV